MSEIQFFRKHGDLAIESKLNTRIHAILVSPFYCFDIFMEDGTVLGVSCAPKRHSFDYGLGPPTLSRQSEVSEPFVGMVLVQANDSSYLEHAAGNAHFGVVTSAWA